MGWDLLNRGMALVAPEYKKLGFIRLPQSENKNANNMCIV
jgi:hypothetical protein